MDAISFSRAFLNVDLAATSVTVSGIAISGVVEHETRSLHASKQMIDNNNAFFFITELISFFNKYLHSVSIRGLPPPLRFQLLTSREYSPLNSFC